MFVSAQFAALARATRQDFPPILPPDCAKYSDGPQRRGYSDQKIFAKTHDNSGSYV
jgi:hypothetical protein